ncbi:MAG: hypothetical protein L6Q77_04490 [Bacteroidetes bacterium]|nr:hypothetical protein [Bacteroidota bacterium]
MKRIFILVQILFLSGCYTEDFVVLDESIPLLATQSTETVIARIENEYLTVIRSDTLSEGAKYNQSYVWDFKDNDGVTAVNGMYYITINAFPGGREIGRGMVVINR